MTIQDYALIFLYKCLSYVIQSCNCVTEAVPKKILELMNVPGLTRENVASHLQVWTNMSCNMMQQGGSLFDIKHGKEA